MSTMIEIQKKVIQHEWKIFENMEERKYNSPQITYALYLEHVNNCPIEAGAFINKNSWQSSGDER